MSVTALHYIGGNSDRGGIVSVIRALATTGDFECVLGVNPGFRPNRVPALRWNEFPPLDGERISLAQFWRARMVAQTIIAWLDERPHRVFHGHSRAGLLVSLWLRRKGESRSVTSVHCYGRQRWFYRWAARQLGADLFWLTPAMKEHYGVPDASSWGQCIPGCVPTLGTTQEAVNRRATGRIVLGGVGALVAWKSWHLILEALRMLPPTQRQRICFRHIGTVDGTASSENYARQLREQTVAEGLSHIVEWRGEQPSSAPLLGEIDYLVVASRREPFSVAMLEALAAGVPVLAADSGGARDVIVPGRNGWLFSSGEAIDLARRFTQLLDRPPDPMRVDPEALRRFTASTVAREWTAVYDRSLNHGRR